MIQRLWRPEGIKLFMDVSTYCNAACPQCHRTNPKTLEKVDWLPLVQWTLEDFKKAFPEYQKRKPVEKECVICGDISGNRAQVW